MTSTGPSDLLFERYLAVLGVGRRRPSLDAPADLLSAHLACIPFENISNLHGRHDSARRGMPGLGEYLVGIERWP